MQNIKTFMDFIWPFSYIGFSILNRIKKEETNIEHIWYPYILNPDTPLEGQELDKSFSEEQRKKSLERLEALGSEYGLEFNSGPLIFNTVRAHKATLYARDKGKLYEFAKEVFDAVFKRAENIADKDILGKIARSLGLDADDMNNSIDKGLYDEQIKQAKQLARDYNVTSVPSFIVDGVNKNINVKEYKLFKEELMK